MVVRNLCFSVFLVGFSAVVPGASIRAEVICASDISFSWVKTAPSDEASAASDAASAGAQKAKNVPPAASGGPTPTIIRFAGVQRAGLDEAGAKANLLIEVNRQKTRASEKCKRDHESFGDCVATKLASHHSTLNSLGFSARAELEKALTKECSDQQGVCLSVESSEPQCRTLGAPKSGEGAAGSGKKTDPKKPESKKK